MNWMLTRFVRTTLNRAMVAAWLAAEGYDVESTHRELEATR